MLGHNRANGLAGGKEKIGYINPGVIILSDGITVLIYQFKIGYFMVFFYKLNRAVYKRIIYHSWLIDRKTGRRLH